MACITIKAATGETRTIPENTPYPPGWTFTGEIEWKCGDTAVMGAPNVDAELAKAGLGLGDAIAWVTKKIGLKQCAPCKARQEILNNAAELGWSETLRQIKETL